MRRWLLAIAAVVGAAVVALVLYGWLLDVSRADGGVGVGVIIEGVGLGLAAGGLWVGVQSRSAAVIALGLAVAALLTSLVWWPSPLEHFGHSPVGWMAVVILIVRLNDLQPRDGRRSRGEPAGTVDP